MLYNYFSTLSSGAALLFSVVCRVGLCISVLVLGARRVHIFVLSLAIVNLTQLTKSLSSP